MKRDKQNQCHIGQKNIFLTFGRYMRYVKKMKETYNECSHPIYIVCLINPQENLLMHAITTSCNKGMISCVLYYGKFSVFY